MRTVLCLLAALAVVPRVTADRIAEIVRIHTEAIGGKKRVEALAALRASGQVDRGEKRVRFSMTAARPDKIRLETESGGRTLVQASDGEAPPWEFDTGTWPPRYRPMNEANAKTFVADAEFDDPLIAGPERGFTLDFAGEMEVDGKKLLRVLVTRKLTETYSLLLDPETYLIVLRVEQRAGLSGRKMAIVTRYSDYRPVAGVLLPHDVTLLVEGRVNQRTKIDRIDPNPALTAETFSRPKAGISVPMK